MKKIVLLLISVILISTGCDSNVEPTENDASELIDELRNEITILKQDHDNLLNEINSLDEKVSLLESNLDEKVSLLETSFGDKEKELKYLRMEIDSFYHVSNGQEDYFESRINEVIRLYGYELQELMFLVENFDYDYNQITVEDEYGKITKYNVSDECKVLVAGQNHTIFQTLDEGKDFLDSVIQNEGNKVILVIKDGIVEQIKMYGHGSWW